MPCYAASEWCCNAFNALEIGIFIDKQQPWDQLYLLCLHCSEMKNVFGSDFHLQGHRSGAEANCPLSLALVSSFIHNLVNRFFQLEVRKPTTVCFLCHACWCLLKKPTCSNSIVLSKPFWSKFGTDKTSTIFSWTWERNINRSDGTR